MEVTYTMIGGDGVHYGPITLEQIKSWINEGRVTAETKILRSDTNSWLPAANYIELGLVEAAPPPVPPPLMAAAKPSFPGGVILDPFLMRRVRTGANWFYLIAVFSVVNYFVYHSSHTFFLVGMGVSLISNDMVVTAIAAGIFALFGFFAGRGHSWAFIAGMVFYALDAVIFVQFQQWLCVAFHVYAIYRIFMGLKANMELNAQRG